MGGPRLGSEARAAFQACIAHAITGDIGRTEADAAGTRAEIAELSRRLVTLERRLRASSGRLAELHSFEDVEAFAGEQFDRVRALPGVAAIELADDRVQVLTDPISIDWQGRRYKLGGYRLTIDLAGDARVESLAHLGPKAGWDHPHVQAGLPCLGNLRPGILKLIAEFEVALAVQLLLDFLTTYQPETAYTPIEGWPSE